ncbi:MAG: HlyD family secretion protein [Rhodospirillaceae bacterium]|nr:HlyD family secretion protein [Rhodospirillaceae bacterium]
MTDTPPQSPADSPAASPTPELTAPERPIEAPPPPKPRNPVRRLTLIVMSVGIAIFAYTLLSDRLTPYTAQATIQAYLVRILPEVSGKIVELAVTDNQIVEAGSLLFRIDPAQYAIAAERATAQLEAAGQSVGASTAGLGAAEANLARAIAERDNIREQTARIFQLVDKGIYAQARGDQATAAVTTADAAVRQAQAELEEARQSLGPQGADNPAIREAMAMLRQAELDLARTTIVAPSDGAVTALQLTLGQVVGPQQSAMTYIDAREIWIDAAFRENSLENIEPGDPVEIVLDIRPGRVFTGHVVSIGFGVSVGEIDPQTGLPVIRNPTGWLRDPQRMSVRIEFDPEQRPRGIRFGSQANVTVYTGDNAIVNGIAKFWIRLIAIFTYVS